MTQSLDLLLINPGGRTQIYQSLGETLTAIEPPVWAGLMATFVRLKGFSVAIVDAEAENLIPAQVAERVAELKPALVAMVVYGHQPSASTQNMTAAGATCRAIKDQLPAQPVLMVGGHVAALPERTLREEAVDFVAAGEGLYTLVELLPLLKGEGETDFSQVRGLWYWKDEKPVSNPSAPLLKNLDEEMPGVAWDLLPMDRYRAHNWHCFGDLQREPYAAIYTTLGCPFRCSFCCIQAPFKAGEKELGFREEISSYRFWSPEVVIQQIDVLVNKYGVRNIKIADEMFVLHPKHVLGICDLIIERGYKLNIWAYARVDTVKDHFLEKLKKAGVNWLALGIEAAAERVREDVQKGIEKVDIRSVVSKIQAAGINVIGNFIFGLPEDDYETMQATLDLATDLNCEFSNFYCAMAYPGSQLYQMALKEGWELPATWSGYSQHAVNSLPLRTKYLTAAQVLLFRDDAFLKFFNSPSYLAMVAEKFGQETADHIHGMSQHRLERTLLKSSQAVTAHRP